LKGKELESAVRIIQNINLQRKKKNNRGAGETIHNIFENNESIVSNYLDQNFITQKDVQRRIRSERNSQ
jgi:hypothetical protein